MKDTLVGPISGTNMNGIDALVASFFDRSVRLHATHCP